jgi:hypothetical protein
MILVQYHFFHHESRMNSLGNELRLRGEKPSPNRLSYGTASPPDKMPLYF